MGVGLYVGNSMGVGRQLDNGLCQDESRLVNWRKCEKEGESKSSRIEVGKQIQDKQNVILSDYSESERNVH